MLRSSTCCQPSGCLGRPSASRQTQQRRTSAGTSHGWVQWQTTFPAIHGVLLQVRQKALHSLAKPLAKLNTGAWATLGSAMHAGEQLPKLRMWCDSPMCLPV